MTALAGTIMDACDSPFSDIDHYKHTQFFRRKLAEFGKLKNMILRSCHAIGNRNMQLCDHQEAKMSSDGYKAYVLWFGKLSQCDILDAGLQPLSPPDMKT
jgi:hypothetical protein